MNLDKGSRQNRSVTSGKGLALRVGPRGLCTNVATARGDCFRKLQTLQAVLRRGGVQVFWGSFPSAVNNQLRTGVDKEHLTV